jgi:nucleoside-diphosphate-sugar epimerase
MEGSGFEFPRILITGANGFIGSVVVRKLVASGRIVRCFLRRTSKTSRIDDLIFERAAGDVRDLSAVQAAASNCNAVIHLASIVTETT